MITPLVHFGADVESSFAALDALRREMDQLFGSWSPSQRPGGASRTPHRRLELYDTGSELVTLMELPGVALDDIDLTLHDNTLTVRASRPEPSREGWRPLRRERDSVDVTQTWRLPCAVDPEKTRATMTDGVVVLRLGKAESAKPRTIAIKG